MTDKLKVGDKVDIQTYGYWNCDTCLTWRIGTIKSVETTEISNSSISSRYKYKIQIDGLSSKYVVGRKDTDYDLAKLHTYTPIHYYLNNPSKVCTISNKARYCQQCDKKYCMVCNLCEFKDKYYCDRCIDSIEYDTIYQTISSSLDIFEPHIIKDITECSMGIDFKCCNNKSYSCSNIISFNNRFYFKYNRDIYNRKIYKYKVGDTLYHVKHNYIHQRTRNIDNQIMRIFCSECTQNRSVLTLCKRYECKCLDVDQYCFNHPSCSICSRWVNANYIMLICHHCQNYYCSFCKSQNVNICTICEEVDNFKKHKELIRNNIGNIIGFDVADIIASFSRGFMTICCDKKCDNTIIINNKLEWRMKTDVEGNKVYRYKINDFYKLSYYKSYNLFGEYGRIFCSQCTKNKLIKCKIEQQYVTTIKYSSYFFDDDQFYVGCFYRDTDEYCKNHAFCNKLGYKHCSFDMKIYKSVNKLFCKKCGKICGNDNDDDNDRYKPYFYGGWDSDSESEMNEEISFDTVKEYNYNKDEYRNGHHLYNDRRFIMKRNNYDKKGMLRTNKYRKKKSYFKRKKDKQSNHITNKKFKKRYQLSLQY